MYCIVPEKIYLSEFTNNKNISTFIDRIYNNSKIYGWAFLNNEDSKKSNIFLFVKDSHDNIYKLDTNVVKRLDVSKYFNAENLYSYSGFRCYISEYNLKTGKYKIGFLIISNNDSGISWTDRYYVVK